MFNVYCSKGLKFLTRIRIGLHHLADHTFRHNFQHCVNPTCSCSQKTETFFPASLFSFTNYHCARQILFKKVNKIDSTVLKQTDQVITKLLLFGNEKLKAARKKSISMSTIEFLQALERFKTSIFNKSLMELYL